MASAPKFSVKFKRQIRPNPPPNFAASPQVAPQKLKFRFKISPFPPWVSLDQHWVVTLRSHIAPVNLLKINRKRGASVSASARVPLQGRFSCSPLAILTRNFNFHEIRSNFAAKFYALVDQICLPVRALQRRIELSDLLGQLVHLLLQRRDVDRA